MNLPRLLPFVLLSLAAANVFAAAPSLKLDLPLNQPTEESYLYPPESPGFRQVAPGISAWSEGGRIRLTYGNGYGTQGSGGIFGEIIEESGRYFSINVSPRRIEGVTGDTLTAELLEKVVFTADLKLPAGKAIEVHLAPRLPADMKARVWPSRFILGRFTGTGEFESVRADGASVSEASRRAFLLAFRDAALNGHPEVEFQLTLHIGGREQWVHGETLQFDNLRLTLAD